MVYIGRVSHLSKNKTYSSFNFLQRNTDIMLYCLILGDSIRNTFLVEVSKDLPVSNLRKKIWEEKKNFFSEIKIDADRLKLWKVNISMKDKKPSTEICAEDEGIKNLLVDENELLPPQVVGNYFYDEKVFSDQPNNHDIHIVIQPDYSVSCFVMLISSVCSYLFYQFKELLTCISFLLFSIFSRRTSFEESTYRKGR